MRFLLSFVLETPKSYEGDSSWVWSRDLARAMTEAGHFVHWLTPTSGNDGVEARVERLPHIGLGREAEGIMPPAILERWGPVLPRTPVDAIVTNNPVHGQMLGHYLTATHKASRVPVVIWNVSVKHPGGDEITPYSWQDMAAWAVGYATWPNIMPSNYALEMARDSVLAYCGPSLVQRYTDQASVTYIGPWCRVIDELRQPRFEKLSLYYGGRFTGTKGGEHVVKTYLQFLMGGREADVHVTAIQAAARLRQVIKQQGADGMVRTYSNMPWTSAIELMTRCHASIFWQSLKMFPAAPLEQMYAGLVVLVQRDEFIAEFLPADYPFLFAGAQEAAAMLRWVSENLEEAQAKVAWVPDYIRERDEAVWRAIQNAALDAGLRLLGASTLHKSQPSFKGIKAVQSGERVAASDVVLTLSGSSHHDALPVAAATDADAVVREALRRELHAASSSRLRTTAHLYAVAMSSLLGAGLDTQGWTFDRVAGLANDLADAPVEQLEMKLQAR